MPDSTERALVREVYAMDAAFMGLGNETLMDAGVTIIRNTDAPLVRDANFINLTPHETVPPVDTLLAHTDTTLAHAPVWVIKTSPVTPPSVGAALTCAGFTRGDGIFLLLEGDLRAPSPTHEVRLIESETDWAAWKELDGLNRDETAEREHIDFPPALYEQYPVVKRARTPAIQYWFADADGAPRAFLSSWEGINGLGMLEDLFTQAAYRHKGLATALIVHAVADLRARGVERIAIPADPNDTPQRMYAAMGFRPLSLHHTFWQEKSELNRPAT